MPSEGGAHSAHNRTEMAYHPLLFRTVDCTKPGAPLLYFFRRVAATDHRMSHAETDGVCSSSFGSCCPFAHTKLPRFDHHKELMLWGGSYDSGNLMAADVDQLLQLHPAVGLVLILRGVPGVLIGLAHVNMDSDWLCLLARQ